MYFVCDELYVPSIGYASAMYIEISKTKIIATSWENDGCKNEGILADLSFCVLL